MLQISCFEYSVIWNQDVIWDIKQFEIGYLIKLKLHNCFVYFIQTINPWRMVFYFFILLLRLLNY